jgi:hypothetical protein
MLRRFKPLTASSLGILALFLMLPPMLTYLRPDTSMGPGTAAGCLIVLAVSAPSLRLQMRRRLFLLDSGEFAVLALVVFAVLHFCVAATLLPVDAWRFFGSVVVVLLMTCAARIIRPLIFGQHVRHALHVMTLAMLACALFSVAGLEPEGYVEFHKPVFPFTEPSHWALAFLPLLAWACVTSRGWPRHLYLATALAAALLLQNLTLIAGALIVASVYAPVGRAAMLGFVTAAAVAVVGPDLTYYTDRLNFSDENQNLSALVYMQGWQMAIESIADSHGWGVGFQQSGINGSNAPATELIFAAVGSYFNLLDGGFLMVKLASDFGVFFIIATGLYIRLLVRSFRQLRAAARGRLMLDEGTVFAHAVVAMYVVEMFVRSNGYLVGTAVIFLSAVMHLHRTSRPSPAV